MKIHVLLCAVLIFFCRSSNGQSFEKLSFSTNEQDYYLALEPMSGTIEGAVVLMPGFGQPPKYVFSETMIPNVAYGNNLLTIILPGWR